MCVNGGANGVPYCHSISVPDPFWFALLSAWSASVVLVLCQLPCRRNVADKEWPMAPNRGHSIETINMRKDKRIKKGNKETKFHGNDVISWVVFTTHRFDYAFTISERHKDDAHVWACKASTSTHDYSNCIWNWLLQPMPGKRVIAS